MAYLRDKGENAQSLVLSIQLRSDDKGYVQLHEQYVDAEIDS